MAQREVITSVEAFEGWRFFVPLVRLKTKEFFLGSWVYTTVWPRDEELEAVCGFRDTDGEQTCKKNTGRLTARKEGRIVGQPAQESDGNLSVIGGDHHVVRDEHIPEPVEEEIRLVPFQKCKCGIYGRKSCASLLEKKSFFRGSLFGRALYAGRMVEGTVGYRAQFCYPKSLEGGVCGMCGKLLSLNQVCLYRFAEARFSRYKKGIQKYTVLCDFCFEKEPRKSQRALVGERRQYYLSHVAEDYGIFIRQTEARA